MGNPYSVRSLNPALINSFRFNPKLFYTPEQRYWRNRDTAKIGLDSSVGRAPARWSGDRWLKFTVSYPFDSLLVYCLMWLWPFFKDFLKDFLTVNNTMFKPWLVVGAHAKSEVIGSNSALVNFSSSTPNYGQKLARQQLQCLLNSTFQFAKMFVFLLYMFQALTRTSYWVTGQCAGRDACPVPGKKTHQCGGFHREHGYRRWDGKRRKPL